MPGSHHLLRLAFATMRECPRAPTHRVEQIASIEFQNSVVIPEYEGFFSIRARLPFLISHPISQPNWKL